MPHNNDFIFIIEALDIIWGLGKRYFIFLQLLFHIPYYHLVVRINWDNFSVVWCEANTADRMLCLKFADLLSSFKIPNPESFILTTCNNIFAVGRDINLINRFFMAWKLLLGLFAGLVIKNLDCFAITNYNSLSIRR